MCNSVPLAAGSFHPIFHSTDCFDALAIKGYKNVIPLVLKPFQHVSQLEIVTKYPKGVKESTFPGVWYSYLRILKCVVIKGFSYSLILASIIFQGVKMLKFPPANNFFSARVYYMAAFCCSTGTPNNQTSSSLSICWACNCTPNKLRFDEHNILPFSDHYC